MTIDQDIEEFKKWALSLGCSIDKIPKRDQLRKMFTSKQISSLKNMMESIRPKNDIKNIRENIFVSKMIKIPIGVMPKSQLKHLPEEMKRFEKIQKLLKEIKDDNTDQLKLKYQRFANEVKKKNLEKAQQKSELKFIKTRTEIYKLKQPELEKRIHKEHETEKRCEEICNKIKYEKASENSAVLSINNCLTDLKDFYSNTNDEVSNNTDNLWSNLRKHFGSTPNSILWTVLQKMSENELNNFSVWQKNCFTKKCPDTSSYLIKGHSEHIDINIEIFNVKNQAEKESENYIEFYNKWLFDIQTKMRILNGDEKDQEEIINDYVMKMIAKSFNEGQIAFFESEIKRATIEIERNKNTVEDHERLIKSTNQLYLDVGTSADNIQIDISQLYQIKDKLLYMKNTMAAVMQKNPRRNNLMVSNGNKTLVNNMSGSFGMNDSALCSTKIDCNMDVDGGNRLDSTMLVPSTTNTQSYSKELNLFAEISLEKFIQLNYKNTFVTSNQLIFNLDENILKILPCHLLTSEGLFDFIKINCQQSNDLQQLHRETFKTDFDLIEVNETDLNKLCDDQNNNISERLDKINGYRNVANVLLDKTKNYLNYVKTNPLEQFIPNTKLFNGRPFMDYKGQFLLYSRMTK